MVVPPPPPPPPPPLPQTSSKDQQLNTPKWRNRTSSRTKSKRTSESPSLLGELKAKLGRKNEDVQDVTNPQASTSTNEQGPPLRKGSSKRNLSTQKPTSSKLSLGKNKTTYPSKVQRVNSQTKDVKSNITNGIKNPVENFGRKAKKEVEDQTQGMKDLAEEKTSGLKDNIKRGSQKIKAKLKNAMACCVPKNESVSNVPTTSNVTPTAPPKSESTSSFPSAPPASSTNSKISNNVIQRPAKSEGFD